MSKKQFYKKKAQDNKKIANERIEILFVEAEKVFPDDKILSNRYVEMARKISMKYNVSLSSEQKRRFCKHCYSYLVPSVNSRVRVRDKMVVNYCLVCKRFNKFGYSKDKSNSQG
jgi:ribonuclease P protein subunit RPR2